MRSAFIVTSIALTLVFATGGRADAGIPPSKPTALDRKIAATEDVLMGDPARALMLAREAGAFAAAQAGDTDAVLGRATVKRLEAEALLSLNRLAEAAIPAREASMLASQVAPASKLAGDIQRTLGAIEAQRGNVEQALRRYQASYRIFTATKSQRARAIALLDIGQVYWDAGDYQRVLRYFADARELMAADDSNLLLALHNGRGEVLRSMGKYREAQSEYRHALNAARALKSDMLTARILTNLADSQVRDGQLTAAAVSLRSAFSYARKDDVAEWRPFIHGVATQLAAARGDLATARREAEETFAGQDLAKTTMPYREAHEIAADVYDRLGDQAQAMRHLRAFQRLDKEAQRLIATNAAQLMAAQFDFTNQNLRISQLKRGQLERDIRIERQRTRYRTNLLLGLLLAGGTVLAIALYGFFSVRRSRDQVRAANDDLAGSNRALEKALKAKTEFLATTSHEIRTPLNGILGMTQVLLADRRVEPDVRDKIQVVHGAGETMQALVDDLLDVAKLEHGELTLAFEPTQLDRLLDDAVRLWRAPAETKGLLMALETSGLSQPVLTDSGRVRQILFNLLSNAVKFTLSGRISVAATIAEDAGSGAMLTLRVADTGIGIAPADQAAIFEAFSQVDGGTTRQFSGTGLGLSIVRSLTERLGGTVSVESELGEGATFIVRLPVAAVAKCDSAAQDVANVADVAGAMETARILLIDSDQASQSFLRIMLAATAAAVDVADDLTAAQQAITTGEWSCVLLNASHAHCGHYSLAAVRQFADSARLSGTKLVLMQSLDATPSIGELMTVGADQLIVKPIAAPDLLGAIGSLWSDTPAALVAPALTAGAREAA